MNILIEQLIEERRNQGLTQRDIARKMKRVPSYVSKFESSQDKNLCIYKIENYAKVLGLKLIIKLEK